MKPQPVTALDLVEAVQVIELQSTTRDEAIAELVRAMNCAEHGISDETLITAIHEREAAAQTVVAEGLAIPHASVDWDCDFRVIVGRSRKGVQFGADTSAIHLVVLLVTGKNHPTRHLQVLSALAELFNDADFRRTLIDAPGPKTILKLLRERASRKAAGRARKPQLPELSIRLTSQAVHLATSLHVQAVLLAVDRPGLIPWHALAHWNGRILIVATQISEDDLPSRKDIHSFEVPHAGLSRFDRINLGLLLASSNGLVNGESAVVCVTGQGNESLDCIAVVRPVDKLNRVFRNHDTARGTARIPPAVILRVISLAIELASEGREGKAVGTMFVIGDTRQVQKRARQLVLNPFHGYARRLRNILDPGLAETVKEYASLDGAFIVAADGTLLSAGTYLIPETSSADLPGGLGTRHQAAAAITLQTKATAVVVSQSTGKVTVFQNGISVLELERSSMTRW